MTTLIFLMSHWPLVTLLGLCYLRKYCDASILKINTDSLLLTYSRSIYLDKNYSLETLQFHILSKIFYIQSKIHFNYNLTQSSSSVNHPFWIKVAPCKSACSTVSDKFTDFGGNPSASSKLLTPLIVAIWLYTSWTGVSRLAYIVIVWPFKSLALIAVTSLFLLGSKIKFSQAFPFLANLLCCVWPPPSDVPYPENAT